MAKMINFIPFPINILDKMLRGEYNNRMKKSLEQLQNSLLTQALRLALPPQDNYHNGLLLPEDMILPDNILCFYHNFPFPEIQHNRYCIIIPFDRIEYVLNGIPLEIAPGKAVFQCPYAAHTIRARQRSYRRLHISFDLDRMPDYFPDRDTAVDMSAESWRLAARILRLFQKHDAPGCALEVYRLCRELKGRLQMTDVPPQDRLLAAVEHITEFQRTRRENIKSIAEKIQMSESNLRLRFRKENGISLGKFLQQHKLEIALYRLQYTRQNIGEIAKVCGYDSPFSFSRFFKKQMGISPLQWRQLQQKKN